MHTELAVSGQQAVSVCHCVVVAAGSNWLPEHRQQNYTQQSHRTYACRLQLVATLPAHLSWSYSVMRSSGDSKS